MCKVGTRMLDLKLEVLSHRLRRHVLYSLLENQTVDIETVLAESDDERAEGVTKLHHVHLPKLAAHEFIRWEPGSERIERGREYSEIKDLSTAVLNYEETGSVDAV